MVALIRGGGGGVLIILLGLTWAGCQKPEDDIGANGGGGTISIMGGTGGAVAEGSGGATVADGSGGAPGSIDAEADTVVGTGGAGGESPDAAPPVDLPSIADAAPVSDVIEVWPMPPPFTECATPSIHRLQEWRVASETTAMTTPAQGSILVKQDDRYVGRATFGAGKWHAISVWLGNVMNAQVDLSASTGLTLTYSATAPLYLQMRAAVNYSGGDHYLVELPSTNGALQSVFVSLAADRWTSLPRLGVPKMPFADMVKQVRAFFFIGDVPNNVIFTGLLIDGYTPTCK